eukprot:6172672-Pleurochrysis_carterae.AAC.2
MLLYSLEHIASWHSIPILHNRDPRHLQRVFRAVRAFDKQTAAHAIQSSNFLCQRQKDRIGNLRKGRPIPGSLQIAPRNERPGGPAPAQTYRPLRLQ